MFNKVLISLITIIIVFFVYILFIFDVNNYKADLEQIISEKANVELRISGELSLNLGINSTLNAEKLSIRKNNLLVLESEAFYSKVSLSQVLQGRFDINSVQLLNSKLYGLNIDESIIKTYSLLSGKNYDMKNKSFSYIKLIDAKGYYQEEELYIKDIDIKTELLEAKGFGRLNPKDETINLSANSSIIDNEVTRMKYGKYYPVYLSDTELPIIISGNYINPKIDIKISDVIAKKLKDEIKSKAIESIKDKIRDKIQSDINLKLPF